MLWSILDLYFFVCLFQKAMSRRMEWKSSAWMTSRVIDPFAACVIKSFHATSGKLGSRLSYGSGIKPFVVDFTLCHRRQTCQAGIQFSSSNMKLLFFLFFFSFLFFLFAWKAQWPIPQLIWLLVLWMFAYRHIGDKKIIWGRIKNVWIGMTTFLTIKKYSRT